jgi:hypothetical protein
VRRIPVPARPALLLAHPRGRLGARVIGVGAVAAGRFADDPTAIAHQRTDWALTHDTPLEEMFGHEPACADLAILHKTDLAGPIFDAAALLRLRPVVAEHDVLQVKSLVDIPGRDRRQVVPTVGSWVEHYLDRRWFPGRERVTPTATGKTGLDRAAIRAPCGRAVRLKAMPRAQLRLLSQGWQTHGSCEVLTPVPRSCADAEKRERD